MCDNQTSREAKLSKIVDTNVPLTAVTTDVHIPLLCRQACVQLIARILRGEVIVVVDDQNEVLQEYRRNMHPDPNPSAGLASQFLMYLLTHQWNRERVYRAPLEKDSHGNYLDFPPESALATFDPSDRKWVAIAVRVNREMGQDVRICNATDSDWLNFKQVFAQLGILIEFLC